MKYFRAKEVSVSLANIDGCPSEYIELICETEEGYHILLRYNIGIDLTIAATMRYTKNSDGVSASLSDYRLQESLDVTASYTEGGVWRLVDSDGARFTFPMSIDVEAVTAHLNNPDGSLFLPMETAKFKGKEGPVG